MYAGKLIRMCCFSSSVSWLFVKLVLMFLKALSSGARMVTLALVSSSARRPVRWARAWNVSTPRNGRVLVTFLGNVRSLFSKFGTSQHGRGRTQQWVTWDGVGTEYN